jgi:hypothetical protein
MDMQPTVATCNILGTVPRMLQVSVYLVTGVTRGPCLSVEQELGSHGDPGQFQ